MKILLCLTWYIAGLILGLFIAVCCTEDDTIRSILCCVEWIILLNEMLIIFTYYTEAKK